MKKMKNILILILGVCLISSCYDEPGTTILFSDEFLELDAATTITGSRESARWK